MITYLMTFILYRCVDLRARKTADIKPNPTHP